MLAPLLGSSADASTAFAEHFDDDGNRLRDLLGSLALVVAASMLVWTAVTAWKETSVRAESSIRDLSAIAAVITASTLVASALLLTVPLTTWIGDLTDDPGIDTGVQAGIAQAGTVVLMVAALGLALTTVLLARLGRQNGVVPRWITGTACSHTLPRRFRRPPRAVRGMGDRTRTRMDSRSVGSRLNLTGYW
jgi:hypothetical protein